MIRHFPRKRFGQHFLHDARILDRLVDAIAPAGDDILVEIGPGEGALTGRLLERARRVEAIEIDRDLAAHLAATFPAERLTVYCADVLDFDFARLPAGMRVVGNLPYNISTPLLFRLAEIADRIRDMYFMLQAEVVDRMVAPCATPEYGRLSVMLQTRFAMAKLFRVAPGAFRPPPKVDSAVVRLVPLARAERPLVDRAVLASVVVRAFSARRKMLRNALGLQAGDFAALDIDPGLRPENLSPADYVRIAQYLAHDAKRQVGGGATGT